MAKYLVTETIKYIIETVHSLEYLKEEVEGGNIHIAFQAGVSDNEKFQVSDGSHFKYQYEIIEPQTSFDEIRATIGSYEQSDILTTSEIGIEIDDKYYDEEGKILPKWL